MEAHKNDLPQLLRCKVSMVFPPLALETMISTAEPVTIEKALAVIGLLRSNYVLPKTVHHNAAGRIMIQHLCHKMKAREI
jgi:hypothetical protein